MFAGVVVGVLYARRMGLHTGDLVDVVAPSLPLAQAIGRIGNWFNQELFGRPSTLPWAVRIDPEHRPARYANETSFQPTFLYEMLWNLAGVALLLVLDKKFAFRWGRLFWLYAMYYTLGRVWIEALRIDDAEQITLFGITTRLNVWTSIFVFIAALVIFLVLARRGRPVPDTPYLPGREPEKEAVKDPATVTSVTSHDVDAPVSDSGSRDNLPDNQSDPGNVDGPRDASVKTVQDTTSTTEPSSDATAARKTSGSSPGADDTK